MRTRRNQALKKWRPPEKIGTLEWNEKFRRLSAEESPDHAGKFDTMNVPWIRGPMEACDDPNVWKIVCMKSSQWAWTSGVVVGYLMKRIDIDPCNVIVMLAKEREFDTFFEEKFAPAVNETPRIRSKIDVSTSRRAGVKKHFRRFLGGFIKLVGSNSPSSGKSSTIEVAVVEEPDDANTNVKGQGDSIKNLEERTKQVQNRKVIYGGTPTIDGLSAIQDAYQQSDQCKFFVKCHDCGEAHVLDWDNVDWDRDGDIEHEVYGRSRPSTAWYSCPHCGSMWDDDQRWKNVVASELADDAGWTATAEFRGIRGYAHVNELYMANNYNSRLERLVERYLEAQHKKTQGEVDDWITFVNNALGLPYKHDDNNLDDEALRKRAESYAELIVPAGGLALTAGIDVQHDRLAIVIVAWGRGEESWRIYWGEISAKTSVTDVNDPVWTELEKLVYTPRESERGYLVPMSAVSIDSSDGQSNDAVYAWVRKMNKKYGAAKTMAVKGSSDGSDKEIFSAPRTSIDHKTATKASRFGLRVFIVGTNKAKDLFTARLQLEGGGAGRVHYYENIRGDYYEQITSEVKAPSRRLRGRMVWQKKAGVRNEAFDCEVYGIHAARAERLHLKTPEQWDALEAKLQQVDLFSRPGVSQETGTATPVQADPYDTIQIQGDGGAHDEWYG